MKVFHHHRFYHTREAGSAPFLVAQGELDASVLVSAFSRRVRGHFAPTAAANGHQLFFAHPAILNEVVHDGNRAGERVLISIGEAAGTGGRVIRVALDGDVASVALEKLAKFIEVFACVRLQAGGGSTEEHVFGNGKFHVIQVYVQAVVLCECRQAHLRA